MAVQQGEKPVGIPDIAESEGLSVAYAAKLLRLLRQGGLVKSVRGAHGGYFLTRPADEISIWQVLLALDGSLYSDDFCRNHAVDKQGCHPQADCSLRHLWAWTDRLMADALGRISVLDIVLGTIDFGAAIEGFSLALEGGVAN